MQIYRQRAQWTEESLAQSLSAQMRISVPMARLLILRGVRTAAQAAAFLSPDESALCDPYRLSDMSAAAARIQKAVRDRERIVVYGDYDVDGVTASSILNLYLQTLGAAPTVYLPDRHGEGYGLNAEAVTALAEAHTLMITVDCGITAHAEVDLARSLGLDTVITDHHACPAELPEAAAVVNPHIGDYPEPRLCGAAVALKLVQALGGIEAARRYYDLAALGTIADLVPLLGENRAIAALGLAQINRDPRPGLQALIRASGLGGKRISAGHVAFGLAPRINAGGRIGHSLRSVTMLCAKDIADAEPIAAELAAENASRQEQEKQILEEAVAQVEAQMDFLRQRALVVAGEGWNSGVIGIVASRLVERYHWPAIVLTREGDHYTGSGRSIPGVHLYNALHELRDLFTRFGGHEMAAGMTLPAQHLEAFRRRLSDAVERLSDPLCFLPTTEYDLELRVEEVSIPFIQELEKLQPTGMGNPAPLFRFTDLTIDRGRTMGKDQAHLRMDAAQDGIRREVVAFRMGARMAELDGRRFDLLGSLEINEWNGNETPRILAKGFKAMDAVENGLWMLQRRETYILRDYIGRIVYTNKMEVDAQARIGRQRLAGLLRRGVQGILMVALTAKAARGALTWLRELELLSRIELAFGSAPLDPRRYHALLVGPDDGAALAGYAQVVLLDGAWALPLLADCGPVQALEEGFGEALAGMDTVPGREEIGGIYRALRRLLPCAEEMEALIARLAREAGCAPEAALTGLEVLRELELIACEDGRLCMPRGARKRDLSESRILAFLAGSATEKDDGQEAQAQTTASPADAEGGVSWTIST